MTPLQRFQPEGILKDSLDVVCLAIATDINAEKLRLIYAKKFPRERTLQRTIDNPSRRLGTIWIELIMHYCIIQKIDETGCLTKPLKSRISVALSRKGVFETWRALRGGLPENKTKGAGKPMEDRCGKPSEMHYGPKGQSKE